jgi:hypothetical protein
MAGALCHLPFTLYHLAMSRISLAALLLLAFQSPDHQSATSQTPKQQSALTSAVPNPPLPIETPHIVITVSSPTRAVAPGARLSLSVDVAPKPKMHVYAPDQPDYIPVSLAVTKSADYVAHPPVFPPAEPLYFKPLDETQLVYSKPFRIVQDITIARTPALRRLARTPGATIAIGGTLRYQACDDKLCYPPRNVPVTWTVPVH